MNSLKCKNCGHDAIYVHQEDVLKDREKGGNFLSITWHCCMCQHKTVEIRPMLNHPDYGTEPKFYLIKYMFESKPEDIQMKGHWDA